MVRAAATCPKCNNVMEPGFIADFTYGSVNPSSWVEGHPEKSL